MSLADLKKKLIKGASLIMTYNEMGRGSLIGLKRYVIKTNTTGIYLNENKEALKGSFLDYPKASLLEFTEKGFNIYEAGYRPLTETEQEILNNTPRDQEQEERDVMTDTSVMWYRKKAYLKEKGFLYLDGHTEEKGLRYDYNTKMIRDEKIKGKLSLSYEWGVE